MQKDHFLNPSSFSNRAFVLLYLRPFLLASIVVSLQNVGDASFVSCFTYTIPTKPFPILKLSNPSHNVPEVDKTSRYPVF